MASAADATSRAEPPRYECERRRRQMYSKDADASDAIDRGSGVMKASAISVGPPCPPCAAPFLFGAAASPNPK